MEPTIDVHFVEDDAAAALRADVAYGLTRPQKELPPKWFYDARGSELFERITELPEYYPTRTEAALLTGAVDEIAAITRADTLVELGAGSAAKTRLLLDALGRAGGLRRYVPQDVSVAALEGALAALEREYPDLELHGVVGDFTRQLDRLPGGSRRLVAFLGGTIGNLLPDPRAEFLTRLRAVLEPGEWFLLGVGLVVPQSVVVPAYDDAAGVTAEFNRNVLRVLNRELGADVDVAAFAHRAVWVAEQEWIEMRLVAERPMTVRVPSLGPGGGDLVVAFAEGEELVTEVSAKFRPDGIAEMLAKAGFGDAHTWTDADERFALTLARAV